MSYILDALRRADAERDRGRGAVPHLHTQAAPMNPSDRDDDAPAARPWLWLAAGLALGLLAAVVWMLGFRSDTADRAAEPTAAMPAPVTPGTTAAPTATPRSPVEAAAADGAATIAPVAPPVTAATPPPTTPPVTPSINSPTTPAPSIVPRELPRSPAPALARPEPPATTPATNSPTTAPTIPSTTAPAKSSTAPTTASTTTPAPVAANAPPAPSPTASAAGPATGADSPIRTLAELPEDIRRELPSLAFGGSMYSQNAASRMVIVNGQLLREGDKVSPAVTIEQIRTRSVVLRYKTYRYEMAF